MSDDFQKNEISWRDTAPDTPAPERTGYERMFHSAVAALAEISDALGIPEDVASTANGNAEILHAIRALLKERYTLANDAAKYRWALNNSCWIRGEHAAYVAIPVAREADLSCVAMRDAAIDEAMEKEVSNGHSLTNRQLPTASECIANARLIAAAPDLLAALKAIVSNSMFERKFDHCGCMNATALSDRDLFRKLWANARDAIEKAEGRSDE